MDRVMVRNRVRARAMDRLGLYLDRVMVRNREGLGLGIG